MTWSARTGRRSKVTSCLPTTRPATQVSDESIWKHWIVHVISPGESWFLCDEGECAYDPLEGFVPAVDLECTIRGLCPPHTRVTFNYALAA